MNFWISAFSGRSGNASILRVLLSLVVLSVCIFINAVTWRLIYTGSCPMIDSAFAVFMGGLPVLLGALIKWGDSIDNKVP